MNKPKVQVSSPELSGPADEKSVEKDDQSEKKGSSANEEVRSISSEAAAEEARDLDPVALNKAYRFAVNSSLALVRVS